MKLNALLITLCKPVCFGSPFGIVSDEYAVIKQSLGRTQTSYRIIILCCSDYNLRHET